MQFIFYDSYLIIRLISNFLDRIQLLKQKLLKQGYVVPRWKSSLQNFYGHHHDLVVCCTISISPILFWWDPWRSSFCLFFFILSLLTNVVCVSGLSLLDWPIGWFSLTFIYPDNAKFIFSHISFSSYDILSWNYLMFDDIHVWDIDKGQRGTLRTDNSVFEIGNVLHHLN